jgi:RNA polymerase sigma-70 factor (ECF subfamily)
MSAAGAYLTTEANMGDSLATRPSLLVRIRDARDAAAWARFVEVYAPLIYGFVRKHRLQDADAADLTQDVLRAVATAADRLNYDPARGPFRGWLFTVVRNRIRTFLARRPRARGEAQAELDGLPGAAEDPAAVWDREYERSLLAAAARQVRGEVAGSTWEAFWQTSFGDRRPRDVARDLGMTVAAVYMAKSRVVARLRELVRQLQEGES